MANEHDEEPLPLDQAVVSLGKSVASIVRKAGRASAASAIDRATGHAAAGARFLGGVLRASEEFARTVRK